MLNETEVQAKLEALIDKESLSSILEQIARICDEKADHILASDDDLPLSQAWVKAAKRIQRTADAVFGI